MPYIMNALDEVVSVQAHGKWFTFQPRQIKNMHNANLAMFLSMNRGENGLVEVLDSIMELEPTNPERAEHIEQKRREGVQKRIDKLEWQRNNLITALRFDVESSGIKADPYVFASKGDIKALEELKKLKGNVQTDLESNAEKARRLLGDIENGNTDSADIRPAHQGRESTSQSAKSGK